MVNCYWSLLFYVECFVKNLSQKENNYDKERELGMWEWFAFYEKELRFDVIVRIGWVLLLFNFYVPFAGDSQLIQK